jgi:hypothetical protein
MNDDIVEVVGLRPGTRLRLSETSAIWYIESRTINQYLSNKDGKEVRETITLVLKTEKGAKMIASESEILKTYKVI